VGVVASLSKTGGGNANESPYVDAASMGSFFEGLKEGANIVRASQVA